ncbi:hypothetical protein DL95DRAFT_477283 [Leptodontidium sp. 2 PMI_412]|nr:hypothetical protein DL95DRAFT_477283 [Leptodontidium sp. 2 PMI_412]
MSAAPTATIVIYETTSTPPRPSSPYTNSNPASDWSALTIASILVTVMGFAAVLAVVFWIFRKEKLAREEERREANASFWPGSRGWSSGNRQGPRKDIARADGKERGILGFRMRLGRRVGVETRGLFVLD